MKLGLRGFLAATRQPRVVIAPGASQVSFEQFLQPRQILLRLLSI